MKYPKLLTSKSYPDQISKNPVIKKYPRVSKAFHKIGLSNCKGAANLDKEMFLLDLLSANNLNLDAYKSLSVDVAHDIEDICSKVRDQSLHSFIQDGEFVVPKSIFLRSKPKSRNIFDILKSAKIKFSKKIPKLNYKVCFSASGEKGAWDIATMSMRGIDSCMNWDTHQSNSLVGSLLDPYVGVVYITDNKETSYGTNMLARAVVRIVINRDKPVLQIDSLYINDDWHYDNIDDVPDYIFDTMGITYATIFKNFLAKKSKIPVVSLNLDTKNIDGILPITKPVKAIIDDRYDDPARPFNMSKSIDPNDIPHLSYVDSRKRYKKIDKYFDHKKVKF